MLILYEKVIWMDVLSRWKC